MIHRYVVSGRVQGVGFRWSAQRKANALGLAGWVSNQEDGTVLTEAAGDEATLAEFERWLRRGPAMARVDSVEKVQVPGEIDLVKPFTFR